VSTRVSRTNTRTDRRRFDDLVPLPLSRSEHSSRLPLSAFSGEFLAAPQLLTLGTAPHVKFQVAGSLDSATQRIDGAMVCTGLPCFKSYFNAGASCAGVAMLLVLALSRRMKAAFKESAGSPASWQALAKISK
jgi:hypothetical protein